MFKGYKPTKAERLAIDRAHRLLAHYCRSHWELDNWTRQEARGYGNINDRVPLVAARALIVKWFVEGADNPDTLLRDAYALRPAAVYMMGAGACAAAGHSRQTHKPRGVAPADLEAMRAAVAAHEAAFDRMMAADKAALRQLANA